MRFLALFPILAPAVQPSFTSLLVEQRASLTRALALSGEVAAGDDVTPMLARLELTVLGVVNVSEITLPLLALAMIPPRKTRAGGRIRVLVRGLALTPECARSRGAPSSKEIMANLVRTIPLKLRVNPAAEPLIAPARVVGREPVVTGNVVPDGRVGTHLVIESTQQCVVLVLPASSSDTDPIRARIARDRCCAS